VEDWRPLLGFTLGNPLTLTVVVRQVLRNALKSRDQIEDFVRQLQTGEAVFEDEASEGRTRSLAASLAYGFDKSFTETERKQLALLHLFQAFVQVDSLVLMGDSRLQCLPEVKGLRRGVWTALLDQAAEIGLVTSLGGGYYYGIHPALPWFFRSLFERHYSEKRIAATRAFVEAIGEMGNHYFWQYEGGNRGVIDVLAAEETNLLHALSLARLNGWWNRVVDIMQGLYMLYQHTGRKAEWSRLVEVIVPDFVDPSTEGPLPGRERDWAIVAGYRVRLAREARRWDTAERVQEQVVNWNRQAVAPKLLQPQYVLNSSEKNAMRHLAVSLHDLAQIQRLRGSAGCVDIFNEALSLAERIPDAQVAANSAFNLGGAYEDLDKIRDLGAAKRWYIRSLECYPKEDRMSRARCLVQLGTVAYRRFVDARRSSRPAEENLGYISNAKEYCEQGLYETPEDALQDLATAHSRLGIIYGEIGDTETSLRHHGESIRYYEAMQDRFGAASARYNAARLLSQAARFADARDWAQAALRDYEACANTDQEVVDTVKLLEQIESDLRANAPP
jgi:tetratricopeptide (TPR) repeat protein